MDAPFRTRFWEELVVASVRHTQRTLPGAPIVLSGDANVWWLAFHLGRERRRDRVVFPFIHELLEGFGLSLGNDQTRATHTAGAALDLVFTSVELTSGSFIVHQGDQCCSLTPLCSPAVGSDHFLCDYPFPAVDVEEPHRVPSACRNFPVVQDWEPVLLAARAKLVDWEVAMQDLSVPDSGLPQRCAVVSALFDYLVAILWDTARSLHPRRPDVPRHRRQPRWWTDACCHALVARNAAWRDFRMSNLSEDYALYSPHVGVTSTVWFAPPAADYGDLGKTVSPACAPRTPRLAPAASADVSDC